MSEVAAARATLDTEIERIADGVSKDQDYGDARKAMFALITAVRHDTRPCFAPNAYTDRRLRWAVWTWEIPALSQSTNVVTVARSVLRDAIADISEGATPPRWRVVYESVDALVRAVRKDTLDRFAAPYDIMQAIADSVRALFTDAPQASP